MRGVYLNPATGLFLTNLGRRTGTRDKIDIEQRRCAPDQGTETVMRLSSRVSFLDRRTVRAILFPFLSKPLPFIKADSKSVRIPQMLAPNNSVTLLCALAPGCKVC